MAESAVGQSAKDAQQFGNRFKKTLFAFATAQGKIVVAIATAIVPKPIRDFFAKAGKRFAKRFETLFQFIGRWFKSRTYSLLIGGIPAILLSGILFAFLVRIPFNTRPKKITQYTGAVNQAIKDKDSVAAELYHRRLSQLGGMNEYNVYKAALFEYERGNHQEAHKKIKSLAPMTGELPGYGPAHSLMARWILSGEIKLPSNQVVPTANAHITRALMRNESDAIARVARAEILTRTGRISSAISELEKVGRRIPSISLAVVELYLSQGDLDSAKKTLRNVDSYYTDQEAQGVELDPMGYIYWTQAKLLLGEFDEADRLFKKAANEHGDDENLRGRALDYFAIMAELSKGPTQQSAERTIGYIRQGLKLSPGSRAMLSKLVKMSGGKDEAAALAAKELDTMLKSDNVPDILWSMAGTMAAGNGDYEKALPLLLKGAKLNPDDALTLNNAAWVQLQLVDKNTTDGREKLTNALRMADQALSMIPDRSIFHETRGQILLALEKPTEAIKALEASLNGTETPTPEIHEALAKAYSRLNNSGVAEMHLDAARRLRGGNVFP